MILYLCGKAMHMYKKSRTRGDYVQCLVCFRQSLGAMRVKNSRGG